MLDDIELGEKEKDWGDRVGVSVNDCVGFFFTIFFLFIKKKWFLIFPTVNFVSTKLFLFLVWQLDMKT